MEPTTVGEQECHEIMNATRVVRCLDETKSQIMKWTEAGGSGRPCQFNTGWEESW